MPSLVEIGPVVLEKKIFKFPKCILNILISSPLKKYVAFNLNKLDSLGLVWMELDQWFRRRRLLNFVHVFSLFHFNVPWKRGMALYLYKLESPLPISALCQVWLKLVWWLWRRRFLNFVNVFSLFSNNLPLQKVVALHLNKLESPSPKMLCVKYGGNWPSGSLNLLYIFLLFCNDLPLEKECCPSFEQT